MIVFAHMVSRLYTVCSERRAYERIRHMNVKLARRSGARMQCARAPCVMVP
jgi:hypothetical protein